MAKPRLTIPPELRWLLPLGLTLAALLAAIQPGVWWAGWLGFSAVLVPGTWGLWALWRNAGAGRTLALVTALALGLRLLAGATLYLLLPEYGHDSQTQNAGYVFYDAYRRDTQAWELAASDQPLWVAFNKEYSTDQYGGLLALSAGLYRGLSPDAHRPLLPVALGALAAALGVPLLWKLARRGWDQAIAAPAIWIFALFPEAVLQGAAQMREPYLMTFFVLVLYAASREWLPAAIGLGGLLLFSPGAAVPALLLAAGWFALRRGGERRIPWKLLLGLAAALLVITLLLGWAWGYAGGDSPWTVIYNWFRFSARWDIYLLEQSSGWVEKLFDEMPAGLKLPFVAGYGLAQPVLPAALIEPTTILWRVTGILRALGWYALVPLLLYALLASLRESDRRERLAWLWTWLLTWSWAAVAAVRAGADQWDNPRYRVILLGAQALLAGYAWARWRARRDGWLGRIIAVEVVFLLFFTEWYLSRYLIDIPKMPFGLMVESILVLSVLILLGGWLWDRRRGRSGRP